MNATLETPVAEIRREGPVLAAEAATDVQPAESLVETPEPDVSVEPVPSDASEIDIQTTAERHKLRKRIQKSSNLSRGMRDRLTVLLEGGTLAGQPEPLIRAADALAMLEEAIPPQLRLDPQSHAQPEHPTGEVFFCGDAHPGRRRPEFLGKTRQNELGIELRFLVGTSALAFAVLNRRFCLGLAH